MMSEDTTSQFIASLVKSLQALCHGYVDFQKNIEIIGHIYINVDSQQKFDYIVNEQVCKNDDESPAMFVSNSFHAMPNRKPVRTFLLNDSPLDLKTHAAKDVTGVDLSTFQPDTGQGRSASRESSQSLSAGSEAGSFSGSLRESSLSSSRQNPENYVSRRKRHLNDISSKLSPTVSPPPSRNRDGERREPRDSPSLRSQYTLGASASKLARRISNELEKQALTNPVHHVQSDSEIHSRLASSNHSPSRHGRHDNSVTYHRHYSGDSSKQIDSVKDPPLQQDGQPLDDSIDLTRVKEEVIDEEQLFDQLDWTRAGRETDQEQAFPRTGPDDPATEGRHANQNDQTEGEDLSSASLYPVMIHQNTAGLPGYGSPVFPQNFTEPSHTMSAGSSPIPSTSGQLSPGSAFPARRPQPGNSGRGYNTQLTPRPGKVPQDVAAKFNEADPIVKREPLATTPKTNLSNFEEMECQNWDVSSDWQRERQISPEQISKLLPNTSAAQCYISDRRTNIKTSSSNVQVKSEISHPSQCAMLDKNNRKEMRNFEAGWDMQSRYNHVPLPPSGNARINHHIGTIGQQMPQMHDGSFRKSSDNVTHSSTSTGTFSKQDQHSKVFSCTFCPYFHLEESFIRRHMALTHMVDAHVCRLCVVVFHSEKDLTVHRKHKHGQGFECEHCGKVFTLKCNLVEHVKRIHEHGINARHFICPVAECQKTFTRPSHLRIHITRNHPEDHFVL